MSQNNNLKEFISQQHGWDRQQLSVIFTEEPKVIVEAPAGYGKTTTMISRIAYLFASGQIPNPKKVLGLTFSVNAALKVKREIAQKLPELMSVANNPTLINDKVIISNYHGFCKSVLKKYGYLLIESFRHKDIFSIKAIGDTEVKNYSEISSQLVKNDWYILNHIDRVVKAGKFPQNEEIEQYNQLIIQKIVPFGYITHNAVILMTIYLFLKFREIQKFYQNYYTLLIVDEFQDTNSIAWNLLEKLISPKSQLLFLGDSLQRIYGFIGALPNIMSLAANKYQMQQISLLNNYRFKSNPEMLNLDANIRGIAEKWSEFEPREKIAHIPSFYGLKQEEEANLVVVKIKELQKKDLNCKIAILCRGRSKNSEIIENQLLSQNVPYFYGMFTDDDQTYIDFHIVCYDRFIKRFGKRKNVGAKSLELFFESVKKEYSSNLNKTTRSLLSLLEALIKKVLVDYSNLISEDKYSLILDIFENRQLKQAMEYVKEDIIISTIHGAKGLEWDYVFLSDIEPWIFPSSFICQDCPQQHSCFKYNVYPINSQVDDFFKIKVIDELSVFYVGVTRARKQVYFSSSESRYNVKGISKQSKYSCLAFLPGINLVQDENKITMTK